MKLTVRDGMVIRKGKKVFRKRRPSVTVKMG